MKTRLHWMVILLISLILIFSTVSCSNKNEQTTPNEELKTGTEEPNQQTETFQDQGIYTGQIDNNSVEIRTKNEIMALQLTDEVRQVIETLVENDEVTFEYEKNKVGQLILTKLEKINSYKTSQGKLPKEKDIEIFVEGTKELRKAYLNESTLGYSIYVQPQFTFSGEEPGKDILFWNNDGNYYIRIEKLPDDVNIEDMRKNAALELQTIGKVYERNVEEIFDPFFRTAKFFLTSSTSQLTQNIMLIEIDGTLFKFKFNFPNGEAAEGVTPSLWAMLKTIDVNQ
ncbi:MAG: hypothetical protein ACH0QD_00610 [Tepidibacillus sp.]